MNGMVLRWGVPALVTVVGGTTLAISATSPDMHADLASRTAQSLGVDQRDWVSVTFDARDAVVTGTATEQRLIDAAIAQVASVHGVRSVRSDVVLAEYASPFPFAATIRDGVVTLTGGVPDETAHAQIALATESTADSLRILSGAPPREQWQAAVTYGLAYLKQFDEGSITLTDLDLVIDGRASSPAAFYSIALLDQSPPPAGVELVERTIVPPLAAPFEWKAEFDGATVRVSGFTPDESFAEALREQGVGGWPVSSSLVLASGAPQDFVPRASLLLENLVRLERGSADISGSTATLVGAPADDATADAIRLAMTPAGVAVELDPPRVDGYSFIATRTAEGIALSGFVPDAPTRERLDALAGVDAGDLALARGAPERFDSAIEFGLDILGRLSEGRFELHDTTLTIEGRAETVADFAAIETTLALGAPQGLLLSVARITPPLASPFTWSAEKAADGTIRMAGFVPSQLTRNALQAAVAGRAEDAATLADGNPEGFEQQAVAALGVLPLLKTGSIAYDGQRWSMSGAVDTSEAGLAATQAFTATGLRDAGWTFSLDTPSVETVALPLSQPYLWRAEKVADGPVTLSGSVPTADAQQTLLARAGQGAIDQSSPARGQPDAFLDGALAGLDALAALDTGVLAFDGKAWSLAGQAASTDAVRAIETALTSATDTTGWSLAIDAADAAPRVSPYRWAATKGADGRISLSGYATTEDMKEFISVRAGTVATDTTEIASGEPAGFIGDVLAGLEALGHLGSGIVTYDGDTWTLAGTPRNAADAERAVAALATATDAGTQWTRNLEAPLAPEPEPQPEPAAPEVASLPDAAVTPAPAAAPVLPDFIFSASKPLGGTIVLDGAMPAENAKRYYAVVAGNVPTDNLTIRTDLPDDFLGSIDVGIRLLASLDSGEFGLSGSTYRFTGRVDTAARRDEALRQLAAYPGAVTWQTEITLLPPLDLCRQRVAAFANRNAIIFQSGSARIAAESLPAVDELAGYLEACPEVAVNVEGHTDSDGEDAANLALSVARAEAVVEALIERGVAFQRLYAVGYGESLPIADNATAAGKRTNRRIAFSLVGDGV